MEHIRTTATPAAGTGAGQVVVDVEITGTSVESPPPALGVTGGPFVPLVLLAVALVAVGVVLRRGPRPRPQERA